jgi:hypothetical protein
VVSPQEALRVVLEVVRHLDEIGIPYVVGGSLASSLHGIPRSTQDADLVADLRPSQIQSFATAVSPAFYASPERMAQAIDKRSSFNMIHHETGIKVDIFILKPDPLSLQELTRRQTLSIPSSAGTTLQVASAEDTVLQKLHWYELGNRVSDRQWTDILGVLKVQRQSLDFGYLEKWASHLKVEDLLRRAYADAGIDPTS